jgi:hypothetical protein
MSIIYTHTSRGYAKVCAEAIVGLSKYKPNDYLEEIADLGRTMRKHVKDSKQKGIEVNDSLILEAEGILQEVIEKEMEITL